MVWSMSPGYLNEGKGRQITASLASSGVPMVRDLRSLVTGLFDHEW
jgi:hypothetical protein